MLQNGRSALSSISNVQMHVDGSNIGFGRLSTIDDTSYIDYDPTNRIPSKRPNVCNDCVCGIGRKTRIVGGNETSVFEYPWLVSMTKQGVFYCAGSLITRRHILTAAHCLEGFETRSIKLVIADSDRTRLASTAIVRRIKSVIIHEEFHTYTFDNDIAIIEMDRPVSLDGIVRTACLPEDKAIDYTGATATVVGWGRTGENKPVSEKLRKVNVPILSQEECDQAGYQKNRLTDNMFCAGYLDGQRDACFGDSGGPLHVKGSYGHLEVIGIISWGRGCARPNFPGIYTRLNNYMECGITNQENRIVGGKPTTPNRYPWIARLVYNGRFHCGASLINNDYVITAAHCVRNLKRTKIRVILGDYDQYVNTDGVAVMRAISAVIRHRSFDMNSYNHDVALLKLRKPVKFTKTVRPVCLPKADSDPAGKEGTVIGWGRTSEGGMLPGKVHEVQVPVWSLTQCRKMKYRANRITNNMICAGKGTQDSCQGDSGGPLLVYESDRLEIAGIVSWGVGCGRPGYPGVYTRVAKYLNWINTNIKESCLCVN
ncbi:hypothetical protein M0802_005945 [Mischocyttarus mexicanus]|nr:hypothetical protein M0802_005945 [Mischocyttarus mexicanus]